MRTLTDWNVKRSGASMTVTGTDENGHEIKISGVAEIRRMDVDKSNVVVAIMHEGEGSILA